jgi:hypothetical protein
MDSAIKSTRALQAWTEYLQTRTTLEWLDEAGIVVEMQEEIRPFPAVECEPPAADDEEPKAA